MIAPVVVKADEKPWSKIFGDDVTVRHSGKETGGSLAVIEQVVYPGGGVPPHMHTREDELFYVVEGDIEFFINGKTMKAGPGTTAYLPKNIPHGFSNPNSTRAKIVVSIMPAGFETFFARVEEMSKKGEGTPEKIMAISINDYGIHFLPKP